MKAPEKLLVVIHNHILGLNLLLSDKDLNLYLSNNVKYGVTTNENGILIMKNNKDNKLSSETINNLLDGLKDVDEFMSKNYGKKNPKTYNEWKRWCIARNRLPDFFGTRDNPIPIDESKL